MPVHRITCICSQCGCTFHPKSEQPFCSRRCFRVSRGDAWSDDDIASLIALYDSHEAGMLPLRQWAEAHSMLRSRVEYKAYKLGLTQRNRPKHPPRQSRTPKWTTDEERRAAIGRSTKTYIAENGHPRAALGLKHTPESRRKMGEASTRMWELMPPEQRAEIAERRNRTNIERYGTGAPVHVQSEQPFSRCRGGKRADLENRYFRSAWEANYARYLNFLLSCGQIKSWEYEPKTFVFHGVTRGALTYTPDFLVTDPDGAEVYHEVKGWMTSQSKTRLKRMEKYYPEIVIRLVDEPVYRALSRQCRGLFPGWE